MALKDINLNIDLKKWEEKKLLKEQKKLKDIEKEKENLKQEWIKEFGEEHWIHTNKITKKIADDISDILYKDKDNYSFL
jgi:hypothetical protein